MSREVESFESCSAWEGANGLPGLRKSLAEGPGGLGESIQTNYKINFLEHSFQRFSQHFSSTSH